MLCVLFCALIAVHGISGMPSLVKKALENETPQDAILYGWVIDKTAPNYLSKGDQIFERNADIGISRKTEMIMDFKYSDSEKTAAQNIAASLKVEGSYGAFSAAASMEFSESSSSNTKTVRIDATTKAVKYEVRARGFFNIAPQDHLTEHFRVAVQSLSNQQLEEDIGVFYATQLDLGGEIRMSYTMNSFQSDNALSVKSSLQASYGSGLMSGSVEASGGYDTLSGANQRDVKITWSAQGGDTNVWLGASPNGNAEVTAIQQRWSDTFTDANLYPANFELKPMWDLVKAVNPQRGAEYQRYLEAKWEHDIDTFTPTEFATSKIESCGREGVWLKDGEAREIGRNYTEQECVDACYREWNCQAAEFWNGGGCWLYSKLKGQTTHSGVKSWKMSCIKA